jgi:hypothetical protein
MIIEEQAFSPSYDLAPPQPPLSSVSCLSFTIFLCRRSYLLTGEGGGSGRGAKSYDNGKACTSINHSMLSGEGGKGEGKKERYGSQDLRTMRSFLLK